jgi:hypothetical protein
MNTQVRSYALGITSLLATLLTTSNANAYPMSGIDSRLELAPGVSSVRLLDHRGGPLGVANGTYRLRFSNKSKSFHIMSGGDHRQEFKVSGGFPRGDLKNFQVSGEAYGNSVDLSGRTFNEYRGRYTQNESRTCSYRCGTDRHCRDVSREVCRTNPRTGQRDCHIERYRECEDVARYCSGTDYFEVDYETKDTVFTMDLYDSINKMELGRFRGVVSSSTDEVSRRLLSSSCRRY